ncbi:MAG: hypothetical protein ACOC3V_02645 [bacterium]
MILYNQYINKSWKEKPYVSEVCFVNINEGINGDNDNIYICDLSYLEFHNHKLNGLYELPYNLMKKLKRNKENKLNFIENNKDIITKLNFVTYYFVYVKVIDDKINPHLNGKFLIFKMNSNLFRSITITEHVAKMYNNVFKLIVKPNHQLPFPDYSDSYYTDKEISIDNFELSVKKEIKFKHFDPLSFKRGIKLNKILKNH